MIFYFETFGADPFFEQVCFGGLKDESLTTFLFGILLHHVCDRQLMLELEGMSFEEIQRMTRLYVHTVDIRPLLIGGGIGTMRGKRLKYRRLPDPPQRIIYICINIESDDERRLQTFAHELVHVFHYRDMITYPDEDETDRIADLWVTKYHDELKELLRETLKL